ncbi:alpha subunit of pyruvate dehydrogenase [Rhodotorula toruloides]
MPYKQLTYDLRASPSADRDVRVIVEAVEEAEKSPEPRHEKDMWTDIDYQGAEPMWLRGRERGWVHRCPDPDLLPNGPKDYMECLCSASAALDRVARV